MKPSFKALSLQLSLHQYYVLSCTVSALGRIHGHVARSQCSWQQNLASRICACNCRRPTYTITCEGGEQQDVPDEALERLREPKSPMMPDVPAPPSIAAPSPSDGTPLDDTPPGRAEPPSPRPPTHSFHTQPSPQAPFAASRPSPTPGAPACLPHRWFVS